jgi:hypothetical protein
MSDPADLARGWFRKGDSDLSFVRQPFPLTHNLEELERRCSAVNPAPDLAGCDLTQLTPYAVQLRYDSSFWPDQVRTAVLTVVPPAAHP